MQLSLSSAVVKVTWKQYASKWDESLDVVPDSINIPEYANTASIATLRLCPPFLGILNSAGRKKGENYQGMHINVIYAIITTDVQTEPEKV